MLLKISSLAKISWPQQNNFRGFLDWGCFLALNTIRIRIKNFGELFRAHEKHTHTHTVYHLFHIIIDGTMAFFMNICVLLISFSVIVVIVVMSVMFYITISSTTIHFSDATQVRRRQRIERRKKNEKQKLSIKAQMQITRREWTII